MTAWNVRFESFFENIDNLVIDPFILLSKYKLIENNYSSLFLPNFIITTLRGEIFPPTQS